MRLRTLFLVTILAVNSLALVSGESQSAGTLVLAVRPSLDIPLAPDDVFFRWGAGGAVSGRYVLPFFRFLSVGLELGYHFAPLKMGALADPSSLSLLSTSALAQLSVLLFQRLELSAVGLGGYYFGLLTEDPGSTGNSFYVAGGLGAAFRFDKTYALGVRGQYSNFLGLHHFISALLELDVSFGG
jgi:hypothetical protein